MPAGAGSPYDVRCTAVWMAASGSGVLTGQSLPATSRAPAACRSPKGYCRPARSAPRNGIVSSVIWSSRQAQSDWMLAATPSSPEPGDVVGVHELEVGDVVAARGIGALEGVQRLADAPVPQPVDVDLEAVAVELADVAAQARRGRRTRCPSWRWRARSGRGRARRGRPSRSRRRRPA